MLVTDNLEPIYNEYSKILLLGSMPSSISRKKGFYYANPKNRFWLILSSIFNEEIGFDKNDKIKFLHKHHIALFDCIKSCEINNSSDSSIKNVIPNDLTFILKNTEIKTIFTIGRKAHQLYNKYIYPKTNIPAIYLPSTSSANASMNKAELIEHFSQIKDFI